MSLVRLLTAGRSLVGLQDETSRYRMRSKNLLPKFGSDKNPFAAPAPSPSTPSPTLFPAPEPAASEMTPPAPVEAVNASTPLPAPVLAERKVLPAATAAIRERLARFRQWAQKFLSRAWQVSRKPKLKSAIPRFSKRAVQGELSLDRIKVVRNDLSEADAEFVAARTPAKPRTEPAESPETRLEFAGTESI